jgi:uncharacterized protein (TIGR00299 family) protein
MRIAYLDCFAGISGDMFLGALLDAGIPPAVLADAVSALGLDVSLRVEQVDRSGVCSTKLHVFEGSHLAEAPHSQTQSHTYKVGRTHSHPHQHEHVHPHEHEHEREDAAGQTHEHDHGHDHPHAHDHPHEHGRSLTRIRELIEGSTLSRQVKDRAIHTFELLGASEAKIHNVPVDQIHFHEVGAVDAIVDIVASAAGIEYLNAQGPLSWFCSAINVGGGMVECAHGTFPVPAPATADLLREMPTYSAHVQKELVTPTGAAILRALAPGFGSQPAMRVSSIGYGAGTRNPKGFPNVLRLSLGEAEPATSEHSRHSHSRGETMVMVLEAAIDDATPQLLAYVAERALESGALDVMLTPVVMKKGRPATLITILCDPAQTSVFESLLLRETTTLGIRKHHEERSCLDREHATVSTPYGEIRVKIGSLRGEELNVMPEFEDCRTAARQHGIPLKQVMQAAIAAYAMTPVR